MIAIYDSFHNLICQMWEVFLVEQKVFYFLAPKTKLYPIQELKKQNLGVLD